VRPHLKKAFTGGGEPVPTSYKRVETQSLTGRRVHVCWFSGKLIGYEFVGGLLEKFKMSRGACLQMLKPLGCHLIGPLTLRGCSQIGNKKGRLIITDDVVSGRGSGSGGLPRTGKNLSPRGLVEMGCARDRRQRIESPFSGGRVINGIWPKVQSRKLGPRKTNITDRKIRKKTWKKRLGALEITFSEGRKKRIY